MSETMRQLIESLKLTQWGNVVEYLHVGEGTKYIRLCPVCDQSEQRGHSPDCPVGAALENVGEV